MCRGRHAHLLPCQPAPPPSDKTPAENSLKGQGVLLSDSLDMEVLVQGHLAPSQGVCAERRSMMRGAYGSAQMFTFAEVKKQSWGHSWVVCTFQRHDAPGEGLPPHRPRRLPHASPLPACL